MYRYVYFGRYTQRNWVLGVWIVRLFSLVIDKIKFIFQSSVTRVAIRQINSALEWDYVTMNWKQCCEFTRKPPKQCTETLPLSCKICSSVSSII